MYNTNHNQRRHKPQPMQHQSNNNKPLPQLLPMQSQQIISRNGGHIINGNNINNIHQSGSVYRLQSKRISVPITITNNTNINTNNKATEAIQRDIQKQLQRHRNCCFVTAKTITVQGTKIPSGYAGKVVLSRANVGQYCCVFGLPYGDVEAVVNPATYLIFGMANLITLRLCTLTHVHCLLIF